MRNHTLTYISIASGPTGAISRPPVPTAARPGMKRLFLRLFHYACGCHHRRLSRVFTIQRRTYKICRDCGREFNYSRPGQTGQGRAPIEIAGFAGDSIVEPLAA
jgi:hypothetical protein